MVALGSAVYDPDFRRITGPEGSLRITRIEHAILTALDERRGRLVLMSRLVEVVWIFPDDEPDIASYSLRVHIHRLRRKIASVGGDPTVIHNVWGAGYLMTDVAVPIKSVHVTAG